MVSQWIFKLTSSFLLLFTLNISLLFGQTSLTPGDIAIVGFNTSGSTPSGNDAVVLVTMVDLTPSTKFIVTDNNWNSSTNLWACDNDEFGAQVTVSSTIAAGSIIYIEVSASGNPISSSTGSLTISSLGNPWGTNWGLNSGGDNFYVLQGTRAVPNFIYALKHTGAFSNTTCSNRDQAGLPSNLTLGTTAIVMASSQNQWNFKCSNTLTGTKTNLLSSIGSTANWASTLGSSQNPPFSWSSSACPFTVLSPEINLQGNGVTILDGNTSISTTDNTDFGSTNLNGTITKSYVIQNTGSASLLVSSIALSGSNASNFSIITSPTTFTIAAGASQTITVSFNPTATGISNAILTITNNDANESTYDFAIRGTGTAPEINIQGNSINIADGDASPSLTDNTDLGSVDVTGTITKTFVLQNTGTGALFVTAIDITGINSSDFSIGTTPTNFSLAPGGSIPIMLTFTATTTGIRNATLSITNNDTDESTYDFSIRATATAPEVNLVGNNIDITDGDITPSLSDNTDFGSTYIGQTISKSFIIQNTGTASLSVTSITLSGTNANEFSINTNPTSFSIAAGASQTITVSFIPTAAGISNATLIINNNDIDESIFDFVISGTAIIPLPEINLQGNGIDIIDGSTTTSLLDNTDFGSVDIGNSIIKSFIIQNTGAAILNITSITLSGGNASDFSIMTFPTSFSIAAGASQSFSISFNPTIVGISNATVTIGNNDSDEGIYDFPIKGSATLTSPEINLQGNGIDIINGKAIISSTDNTYFGSVDVGGSITKSFVIQNTGTTTLSVSSILPTGTSASNFSIIPLTYPLTITPGSSKSFTVSYTPTLEGLSNATITINNNDPDESVFDFAIRGVTTFNLNGSANEPTCNGYSNGEIAYSVKGGNPPYNYNWSNGQNGNLTSQQSNLVLPGLSAGDYSISITDAMGVTLNKTFTITEPLPVTPPSAAPVTKCEGSVTLIATSSMTEFHWYNQASNGTSLANSSQFTISNLSKDSVFYVSSVDQNGCESSVISVNVTIDKKPYGVLIGNDTILLGQTPNTLIVNNKSGSILEWQQADNIQFTNLTSIPNTNTFYDATVITKSTFYRVKIQSGSCPSFYTDTIEIRVNLAQKCNPDSISIYQDENITAGKSVLLNDTDLNSDQLHVSAINNYTTTKGGIISMYSDGTFDYTPPLVYITRDTIQFDVCDNYNPNVQNCIPSKLYIDIKIRLPFKIYSSFSPNGDGVNDEWIIDGIEKFPNNKVSIFNRWGQLVFDSNNYSSDNAWKGENNNSNAPEGTYFYVVNLNDGSEPISGYLVVKK